jgi:hypothetical protein
MNRHLLFGKYICWLFWKMNPRICIKIFEHIFHSVSVRAQIQYVRKYYQADMGRDTKQQKFPFFSVLPDWLDYLPFRMKIRIFFLTRLDILRVSLGIWMISYSHSRITWKPLISNHLQIKYFNQENVGMFYVVLSENVRRATSTIT